MLVITGIFDNERFVPDKPFPIPQKKRVTITIEEDEVDNQTHARTWRELGEAVLSCDEELPGMPAPIRFRTPEEVNAL